MHAESDSSDAVVVSSFSAESLRLSEVVTLAVWERLVSPWFHTVVHEAFYTMVHL